ncbi:MAG: trigger factor [Planctomycetota bacterium]
MAHDHDHDDHEGHSHDHEHGEHCAHDHDHSGHAHDHGEGPEVSAVLEDLGNCKKLLKVEVPAHEVKKEVDGRMQHLRRSVHLKGFRPGKAPQQRIEKLYGKAVRDDVRDHLLRQSYARAVEREIGESNLLGEGTIENVAFSVDEGLRFEVTVHTRPQFELGDYKQLQVEIEKVQVDEEEVGKALDRFRASRGEVKPVEGAEAVVEGEDQLTVDIEVWLADEYESFSQGGEERDPDEAPLKPLKTEQGLTVQLPLDRLGNYAVTDLADSLTGLGLGAWGEAESDLPMDFDVAEGQGEPAVLRIQVKAIRRLALPELTEEWAKEAGHESVADLRREIREQLQQRLDHVRQDVVENKLIGALRDQVGDFPLPTEMLQQEVEQAKRRRLFELRYLERLSEEDAESKVSEEAESIAAETEQALRSFFILDEIARREEIRVSETDVQTRIMMMAAQRNQDPQALRAELERQRVLPQLYHDIRDEKTRTFLRERAVVTEVDA